MLFLYYLRERSRGGKSGAVFYGSSCRLNQILMFRSNQYDCSSIDGDQLAQLRKTIQDKTTPLTSIMYELIIFWSNNQR